MEIILQNRQRSHKLPIKKIQNMAEKLSQAVLVDLARNTPKWICAENLPIMEESSLSLVILSAQAIRNLNKQWLGKNSATDVLSFPLVDVSARHALPLPHTQIGEIFIAYEKACEQAHEYGHSIDRELAFLFVHGMLHILGFDHQDKASEKKMFDRQRKILNRAGYRRL